MPYGTTQGLEDYATLTGRVIPSDANLDAALYNASLYIDGTYWDDFCGEAATDDAAFPRKGSTTVPQRVIDATYEAALMWIADPASLSFSGSQGGQVVKEKVDVIEVQYAAPQVGGDVVIDGTPRFSVIEGLLRPFLCRLPDGVGGGAFVV